MQSTIINGTKSVKHCIYIRNVWVAKWIPTQKIELVSQVQIPSILLHTYPNNSSLLPPPFICYIAQQTDYTSLRWHPG